MSDGVYFVAEAISVVFRARYGDNRARRIAPSSRFSDRCDMAHDRFELEWDHPFLPDAATHVSLFDGGKQPMHIVASGHGADEIGALRD